MPRTRDLLFEYLPTALGALLLVGLLAPLPPARADESAPPADAPPEQPACDQVHLRSGRVFEGWVYSEDACAVVLDLVSETGGKGRVRIPRKMISRVVRGTERRPPEAEGCTRHAWFLLRSGGQMLGTRRLTLKPIRFEGQPGWRIEETIERFARGPHVPAVRIQQVERVHPDFSAEHILYRETGEASSDPDGPRRYERILAGSVVDGVWKVVIHSGESSEERAIPMPAGERARLGLKEHLLRGREAGLKEFEFLDASRPGLLRVRAGFAALDQFDRQGNRFDEFVWQEDDGARLVSRFLRAEALEEALTDGVVAIPATQAQAEAALEEVASSARTTDPSIVRLPAVGLVFRVPDASWTAARLEVAPDATGWRRVARAESRLHVADVRVEWDPNGAATASSEQEAATRLLRRLRTVSDDLMPVGSRRPLGGDLKAWRMDFVGTINGDRIRSVAVMLDQGRGRVLFLVACPEVSWPQAGRSIETLIASIRRL